MANTESAAFRAPKFREMMDSPRAAQVEADRHVCGIMADPEGSAA